MAVIYWDKVNFGYCEPAKSTSTPLDLSTLHILDKDKLFGFPATSQKASEFQFPYSFSDPSPTVVYNELKDKYLGVAVSSLYGAIYGNSNTSSQVITSPGLGLIDSFFPSFRINAPNTFDFFNSKEFFSYEQYSGVVQFQDNGDLLVISNLAGRYYVYLFDKDGNHIVRTGLYSKITNMGLSGDRNTQTLSITTMLITDYHEGDIPSLTYSGEYLNIYFSISNTNPSSTFGVDRITSSEYITLLNTLFLRHTVKWWGAGIDPLPIDPSSPSGPPGGNFDDTSDPVPLPSLPTLSGADTGFTRIYTPTLAQLQSLSRYLWTDETLIETFWNALRKYVEDPMSVFINLSLVPVSVPVSGQEEFKVLFIPTGVTLNTMATQYVDVDCGTLELKEYYGSALDYSPNTKISCFLPYIGTVSLNTDEVMNTTLQIRYRIDVVSGACVACILVNGTTLYQYSGTCAIPIPFSSADFSSYGSALIGVGKAGAAVAAAGMGNVGLASSILGPTQKTGETTTWESSQTERNPATGRQITTGTQQLTKTTMPTTKASFGSIAAEAGGNAVNAVIASKPIVERSGSFSGNSGYLGVRRPYLIIERPRLCMPTDFQKYNGFPSMITLKLGDCTGFTRVQQVFLQGIPATNPEEAEILDFLKAGVIL